MTTTRAVRADETPYGLGRERGLEDAKRVLDDVTTGATMRFWPGGMPDQTPMSERQRRDWLRGYADGLKYVAQFS